MTDDSWRRVDVCATEPTKGGFAWSKPGWKDAHGSHEVAQSQRHALVPSSPISQEGRRRNQEFAFDSWEGTVIASTTISPAIRLVFIVKSSFGWQDIWHFSYETFLDESVLQSSVRKKIQEIFQNFSCERDRRGKSSILYILQDI